MLKENIKTIRKAKGLSQEELAIKLNVVRQTISKWEQGLSVPDSEMLVTLSEVLETPLSTLRICAATVPATGAMWDPANSAILVSAWTTEPVQPMAGTAV